MNRKQFIEELRNYSGQKIITYYADRYMGNFDMLDTHPITITNKKFRHILFEIFQKDTITSIILRQFTDKIHPIEKVQMKNIYGWIIKDGCCIRLSGSDVKESLEADDDTEIFP